MWSDHLVFRWSNLLARWSCGYLCEDFGLGTKSVNGPSQCERHSLPNMFPLLPMREGCGGLDGSKEFQNFVNFVSSVVERQFYVLFKTTQMSIPSGWPKCSNHAKSQESFLVVFFSSCRKYQTFCSEEIWLLMASKQTLLLFVQNTQGIGSRETGSTSCEQFKALLGKCTHSGGLLLV